MAHIEVIVDPEVTTTEDVINHLNSQYAEQMHITGYLRVDFEPQNYDEAMLVLGNRIVSFTQYECVFTKAIKESLWQASRRGLIGRREVTT